MWSKPSRTLTSSFRPAVLRGRWLAGFKKLVPIQEERGLAVYSLAHFCEDVLEE